MRRTNPTRIPMWFRTVLLSLVPLLGGCYVPPGPVETDNPWGWIDPVTGRLFYLYVPTTYREGRPAPVIVSCHGTPPYDVAQHNIDTWKGYGEKYGCIIIAPSMDGTDGIFGDGPTHAMLTDERTIISVLSLLGYKYNIDRANILITGFSGGGFPAYWVGLRNPDIFSCIIAQNCNFNEPNTDGWYPPEARETPIFVYYGENDPGTIVAQSKNAIRYLHRKGFTVQTRIVPGAGHERHPEIAMNFFRRHWRTPEPTMKPVRHSPRRRPSSITPRRDSSAYELPPAP